VRRIHFDHAERDGTSAALPRRGLHLDGTSAVPPRRGLHLDGTSAVPPRRGLHLTALAAIIALGCGHRSAAPEGRVETWEPEARGERIERAVRANLTGDPELGGSGSIVVIVDGRHVVLEGWVGSAAERNLAEADTAAVAGVAVVDDRLLVRPTGFWRR
jgi:hypothetical protein